MRPWCSGVVRGGRGESVWKEGETAARFWSFCVTKTISLYYFEILQVAPPHTNSRVTPWSGQLQNSPSIEHRQGIRDDPMANSSNEESSATRAGKQCAVATLHVFNYVLTAPPA